jgi:hypothetical protein
VSVSTNQNLFFEAGCVFLFWKPQLLDGKETTSNLFFSIDANKIT